MKKSKRSLTGKLPVETSQLRDGPNKVLSDAKKIANVLIQHPYPGTQPLRKCFEMYERLEEGTTCWRRTHERGFEAASVRHVSPFHRREILIFFGALGSFCSVCVWFVFLVLFLFCVLLLFSRIKILFRLIVRRGQPSQLLWRVRHWSKKKTAMTRRSNCLPVPLVESAFDAVLKRYKVRRLHSVIVDLWRPCKVNQKQVKLLSHTMRKNLFLGL